ARLREERADELRVTQAAGDGGDLTADDAERAENGEDERRREEDHAPPDQERVREPDRVVDPDRPLLGQLLVLLQLLALVSQDVLPVLEVVLVTGEAVGGDDRALVPLFAGAAEEAREVADSMDDLD